MGSFIAVVEVEEEAMDWLLDNSFLVGKPHGTPFKNSISCGLTISYMNNQYDCYLCIYYFSVLPVI